MRVFMGQGPVEIPQLCACCAAEGTVAALPVVGKSAPWGEEQRWDFHLCGSCRAHMGAWPRIPAAVLLVLVFATFGSILLWWALQRRHARALCTTECAGPTEPIEFLGGSRPAFEIRGAAFLAAFARANARTIVDIDPNARGMLAALDALPPPAVRTSPAAPGNVAAPSAAAALAAASSATSTRSAAVAPSAAAARRDIAAPSREPTPSPTAVKAAPDIVVRLLVGRTSVEVTTLERGAPARPRTAVAIPPQFFGRGTTANVAGRDVRDAMTYFGAGFEPWIDYAIDSSLEVGEPAVADALPAVRYGELTPAQRAVHLQWLDGGRPLPADAVHLALWIPSVQRRALVDRQDVENITAELQRMVALSSTGEQQHWRLQQLFEFLVASSFETASEDRVRIMLAGALRWGTSAHVTAMAWYAGRGLRVPPDVMQAVLALLPESRTSVVLERAREEFAALFSRRYLEAYEGGLLPVPAARRERLSFYGGQIGSHEVSLPNVLGRPAQFKKAIEAWNACLDDLKQLSTARRKHGDSTGTLSPEEWSALPAELRASVDHPRADHWADAFAAGEAVGALRVMSVGAVAQAAGLGGADRYTVAQLRSVAEQADQVGFAIEPDARFALRGMPSDATVVTWKAVPGGSIERQRTEAASAVLGLCMHVARADGAVDDDEVRVAAENVEGLFGLGESDRMRLDAIRELLLRNPPKLAQLGKKLEGQPLEVRASVGRLVVAVAAVDHIISEPEIRALRQLFRTLDLPAVDLDKCLIQSGARLAGDELVEVAPAQQRAGEALPAGPTLNRPPSLDHARIAALLSDSHEVTSMLAGIFGTDDDTDTASPAPLAQDLPTADAPPVVPASLPAGLAAQAEGLDPRYRGVFAELITRDDWTSTEVRQIAARTRLMPNAILEAINTWSDERLGDFLIEEADGWRIRRSMLEESL